MLSLKLAEKADDEIGPLLEKRYRNRLHRLRQTSAEDAFQLFMNALAASYDPHTQYFSPRTSENFNIQMSLSLEGIGAVLQVEDEYTTIASLVPQGRQRRASRLSPPIASAPLPRGKRVNSWTWWAGALTMLWTSFGAPQAPRCASKCSPDSEAGAPPRVLSLVREAVKLEEQSAQSEVIEVPRGQDSYRIGVIDIPTFYIDFKALQQGDPEYKSTTRDVQRLIKGLRCEDAETPDAENAAPCKPVDGIVIDLRNNGGGSLQEANALTGLFIEAGPTVQIRSASGRVDLFNDEDGQVAWGRAARRASESPVRLRFEIFAGAIQDYQRGLVLGGKPSGRARCKPSSP